MNRVNRLTFAQFLVYGVITTTIFSGCSEKSNLLGSLSTATNGSSSIPGSTLLSCTFNGNPLASGASTTGFTTSTVPVGSTCISESVTCYNGILTPNTAFGSCSVTGVSGPAACSFNGSTIPSGSSVTAYLADSVPFGSSCSSQLRSCSNGTLSGSYTFSSCAVAAPTPTPTPNPTPVSGPSSGYNLGMNLGWIYYWMNTPLYSDLSYQFNGNYGAWDNSAGNAIASVDSTGAPTVAAHTLMTQDYPSGQYILSWDGTGKITVNTGSSSGVTTSQTNGVQHNVVTVTLTQSPGNFFQINATPPVTNVHFMVPSNQQVAGSYFFKDFLNKIVPFSTLRFMDALNTNNDLTVQNWPQRTWPNAGSRGGTAQGMAYEDIINLANSAGKDVWINVPIYASDDYVCRMARLFRYGEPGDMSNAPCSLTAPSSAPAGAVGLNSNSKVYVEYANEFWGGISTMRNATVSMANGSTTCPSAIGAAALKNTSLPWSKGDKGYELGLILTKRNNDIFKTVFGSQSFQVKTVITDQADFGINYDSSFQFMVSAYGAVTGYIDYLGTAPYTTPNVSPSDSIASILSAFSSYNTGTVGPSLIANNLSLANKYGLKLVAYEGGQQLDGGKNEAAVQNNIGMYTVYNQYFAQWNQYVGKSSLFNVYEFVGNGDFGTLANLEDPGSAKWDALMNLIYSQGDINQDGVVNQADCSVLRANYGKSGTFYRSQGDLNGDQTVNAADLALLNSHISGAQCVAP